ncbi:MAG TPA: CopG family transcriptional regulator [Geobacter sp.]|nr:CopG family transcriptional regulator [Geobacter sp.]
MCAHLEKKTTVYLDAALHRALRQKALKTSRSLSDLVNDAVRSALAEDAEDLAAFEERVHEPLVTYESLLKELKENGRL